MVLVIIITNKKPNSTLNRVCVCNTLNACIFHVCNRLCVILLCLYSFTHLNSKYLYIRIYARLRIYKKPRSSASHSHLLCSLHSIFLLFLFTIYIINVRNTDIYLHKCKIIWFIMAVKLCVVDLAAVIV